MEDKTKERNLAEELKYAYRGTYIIIPLIYKGKSDFKNLTVNGKEIDFSTDTFSDLIKQKCKKGANFVKHFRMNFEPITITVGENERFQIEDIQLTAFENGVGFLSLYFYVDESKIYNVYKFVNPGYLSEGFEDAEAEFIKQVKENVLNGTGFEIYVKGDDDKLVIKEAYRLEAAFTSCRYNNLEELDKTTFNVHKIIELAKEFEDKSETDIAHTYGARDVENGTYRWGCCISSQSVSFVYGPANKYVKDKINWLEVIKPNDMLEVTVDDLMLTLLVLHQKYTCVLLNDKIFSLTESKKRKKSKEILAIKNAMLLFKAYGTISSSQISRWNNVCETYRYLLDVNGVDEAIEEIENKIDLLNAEEERISVEKQSVFGTIITVFGLLSIIASVLQIADYLGQSGDSMWLWTGLSSATIAFAISIWYVFSKIKKVK